MAAPWSAVQGHHLQSRTSPTRQGRRGRAATGQLPRSLHQAAPKAVGYNALSYRVERFFMSDLLVAVDVGTGSARAGVLDRQGKLLSRAESPIAMNMPASDHAEHNSEDIWSAACIAIRDALSNAAVAANDVVGIGFDATCSLVVRDVKGEQLSVSLTGENRWDTLVWLDHRALAEADECTATGHTVLDYIGGVMSPEMESPKLMWLKRHLPETWRQVGYFFDLADYLTWKASGSLARSQCTLTCKWTYLAHAEGWHGD